MDTGDPRQNAFDAAAFRDGVHFAMRMGIPDTESERVTFQWIPEQTFSNTDRRGRPYDLTAAPTSEVVAADLPISLAVPVAIEFFDSKSSSGETSMGDFDIGRLKITMLDTSYQILTDVNLGLPDLVVADGNTYTIDYFSPPFALFDVSVYTAFASARDES